MTEENLTKIILLRYALLPRQLLSFDEAYTKDLYDFNTAYSDNKTEIIQSAKSFCYFLQDKPNEKSYLQQCTAIINFVSTFPFLDVSDFSDFNKYNPFDDFDKTEVQSYFNGFHCPSSLDSENDDASIFYAPGQEKCYKWYNNLKDKTTYGLLTKYLSLLNSDE